MNTSPIRTHRTPAHRAARCAALLALAAATAGCSSITSHDLVPKTIAQSSGAQRLEGTVDVHGTVQKEYFDGAKIVRNSAIMDGRMLTDGLKESIEKHGPLAQVRQGGADYVLDVWVERTTSSVEVFGRGYVIDLDAIWRLTQVRDGKVVACEGVKGHGESRGFGSNAPRASTAAAARDMIERGLAILSDQSTPHLSAMTTAGLRPSMGDVVPEGLVAIMKKVRQNWSKLSTGMTVAEVESLLGPVTSSSAGDVQTGGHTQYYSNGHYALAFIDGKLSHWELGGK